MKNSKWIWINIAVAIGLVALSVFGVLGVQRYLKDQEDNKMFTLKADDIVWFSLDSNFNGHSGGDVDRLYFPFTSDDRNEIAALVDCIKAVKENNRIGVREILLTPRYYTFIFQLKNGDNPEYTYNVYYTDMDGEVNDPFDAFFALPSVQEKLEKARENYRAGQ